MAGVVIQAGSWSRSVKRWRFDWTCDGVGDADAYTPFVVSGELLRVVFIPVAGVANLYDVVLTDSDGLDTLGGVGANLSNVTSTHWAPGLTNGAAGNFNPTGVDSILRLVVSNGGITQSGIVVIYWR